MVRTAMEPRSVVVTFRNSTYTTWMSTQMSYANQLWYIRRLGVGEN